MSNLIENPSRFQEDIFDFIDSGSGNGRVNAVAGGGKSSTLLHAAENIDSDGLSFGMGGMSGGSIFLAFNKSIATELDERLADTSMSAKTIHSVGYGALSSQFGRLNVEGRKYRYLIRNYLKRFAKYVAWENRKDVEKALTRLVDLTRLKGVPASDKKALQELCEYHGGSMATEILGSNDCDRFLSNVKHWIEEGVGEAQENGEIDFTDMIYLPSLLDLPIPSYSWVFIDEAQDLSAAQLAIASGSTDENSRVLAVGDPSQSVYGFAGADVESFKKVGEKFNTKDLPLSICYRCPTSHIELAQELVPHIEAAPWAEEGIVEGLYENQIFDYVEQGDMILSRKTSPLINLCLSLIKNGRNAKVKGRSIAETILNVLDKISDMQGFTYSQIEHYLQNYMKEEVSRLKGMDASTSYIDRVIDQIHVIQICAQNYDQCRTIEDLGRSIRNLFSDKRSAIWLSTIHRAKGLENDRIFILHPEDLPLTWDGQKDWQYKQEINLEYVAKTRSSSELFIVEKDPDKI